MPGSGTAAATEKLPTWSTMAQAVWWVVSTPQAQIGAQIGIRSQIRGHRFQIRSGWTAAADALRSPH